MIDRVLHELVEDDCERSRDLTGQLARVALHLEPDGVLGRRGGLLDEPRERAHDLVERNHVACLPRQRLVHDCDGTNPPFGLRERCTRLGRL